MAVAIFLFDMFPLNFILTRDWIEPIVYFGIPAKCNIQCNIQKKKDQMIGTVYAKFSLLIYNFSPTA